MKKNMQWLKGHMVLCDGDRQWYQAFGPNAKNFFEDFIAAPIVVAAGDASPLAQNGWTITFVEAGGGDTTAGPIADALGGWLDIITDAGVGDGLNAQVSGEAFAFNAAYPTYFGCRFRITADATNVDLFAGLCITDNDLLGGMTEGVYFNKPNTGAVLNLVLEEAGVATTVAGPTLAAGTWYTAEFVWNGDGTMDWWVNGVLQTRPALTNLPNAAAVHLTPSLEFKTAEANANTCDFDWIRAIQIQQA